MRDDRTLLERIGTLAADTIRAAASTDWVRAAMLAQTLQDVAHQEFTRLESGTPLECVIIAAADAIKAAMEGDRKRVEECGETLRKMAMEHVPRDEHGNPIVERPAGPDDDDGEDLPTWFYH